MASLSVDVWTIATALLAAATLGLGLWLAQIAAGLSNARRLLIAERSQLAQTRGQTESLQTINRSFIEQAPAAMLLVRLDGEVTYFNQAAADMFALADASLGKHVIELVRDHDLDGMVRRALNGGPAAVLELTPPGSHLVLLATVRPITAENGSPLGAAVTIENLTDLRRMEVMRRDLLANVSHELRTPLAGMKALVETLQNGALDDPAAGARFLGKLDGELDRLTFLVRDVLELSRIESGSIRLTLQAVPVRELVAEAIDRLQTQVPGVSPSLEPGPDVKAIVDRQRCGQVLANLLQNAAQFTPAGGAINVSWKTAGGEVDIHVRDTGAGIPEDDLPRLFERFYKVDKARVNTASQGSGTGLGLAIVKHLVTAMGGSVGVTSQWGAGSDFWFTLPLAANPVAA